MPTRKKVMLLTYYWPPAGGAGVQRWLKMSHYLTQHCDLTIYVPEDASYPVIDETLAKEVPENVKIISHKIQEPYAIAEKINPTNKTYKKGQIEEEENQSLLSKVSLWVRANVFIPDARSWWILPSSKFLSQYLKENPQDVIISTGPPHSVHVIGLRLKLNNPDLKWIADFRDPWTKIDYFEKLPLNSSALKKHQKLEKEVLKYADKVVTVSPSWADELEEIGNKNVKVIYNGYDRKNFTADIQPTNKFTITYIGSLNDDRNPSTLWNVLNHLCTKDDFKTYFELKLIGNISTHVKNNIKSLDNLKNNVNFVDYLPHQEAIHEIQKSHILLLLINQTNNEKGIIPGKFFEYLAAKRKILCLGSKGIDIHKLIEKTNAGVFVERNDAEKLENTLCIWHQKFKSGMLNKFHSQNCGAYSRKEAAYKFVRLIDNI